LELCNANSCESLDDPAPVKAMLGILNLDLSTSTDGVEEIELIVDAVVLVALDDLVATLLGDVVGTLLDDPTATVLDAIAEVLLADSPGALVDKMQSACCSPMSCFVPAYLEDSLLLALLELLLPTTPPTTAPTTTRTAMTATIRKKTRRRKPKIFEAFGGTEGSGSAVLGGCGSCGT
jgi:hypothetical protein